MRNKATNSIKRDAAEVFRTADWRWRAACRTDPSSIPSDDAAFAAALAIHDGDALFRAELESWVLAGVPQGEIASRMGISAEAVACYQHWFLDVGLSNPCWVVRDAIGRHPSGVLGTNDVGPLWRWIGFHYGPSMLEIVLNAVDRKTLQASGIDAYLAADVRLDPKFKVFIQIERMPIPQTAREWKRLLRYQQVLSWPTEQPVEELLGPLVMNYTDTGDHRAVDVEKTPEVPIVCPSASYSVPAVAQQVVAQSRAA